MSNIERHKVAKITDQEMLQSVQEGFKTAFGATDSILDAKNSMRGSGKLSAKFVYEVSKAIHTCLQRGSRRRCLRVIKVDGVGEKKPGEWLVDACITEEHCESENLCFIDQIVFAMESETDSGKRAFNRDFAKLVHLNAEYKLYLDGLHHTTYQWMKKHIRSRCEYVEAILNRIRPEGDFYLGFWPSPEKPRNSPNPIDSIWRGLQCGEWPHLNEIRLWRFDKCAGKLIEVRPEGC